MINRFELCGRLCADPSLKVTDGGTHCTTVTIAVGRPYKNSDGTRDTDFFRIDLYRHHAELVCKCLKKGESLWIEGSLQVRCYLDPAHGDRRWVTDYVVKSIQFVDSKRKEHSGSFDTDEFFEAAMKRSYEIMEKGDL